MFKVNEDNGALRKKSTQKTDSKRFRDGEILKFSVVERSFGAINRKSLLVEYIYGVIPLQIIELD